MVLALSKGPEHPKKTIIKQNNKITKTWFWREITDHRFCDFKSHFWSAENKFILSQEFPKNVRFTQNFLISLLINILLIINGFTNLF